MEAVALPKVSIVYNGKNITESIRDMVIAVEYVDTVEGESSSFEVTLDNQNGLWSNEWYPNKGDTITASISSMDCGTFTIDEVVLSGLPDTVKIRCLENVITKQELRTKRSKAHESKSLRQIAQHVASVNGLTLVGNVPNILFERVSQHRESDLKFLRRIGYEFGCIFSVRDNKLIFTKLDEQDKKRAAFSKHKSEMKSYTCTDKTFNTFKAVRLLHHKGKEREVISHSNHAGDGGVVTLRNNDGYAYTQITSGDTLVAHRRVESKGQAIIAGDSILYRANTLQQSGSFVFDGDVMAVSGVNMEATGLGVACSGIWNIRKATHSIDRGSGWVATVEVKRIALISAERAKETEDKKKGSGGDGGFANLIGTGNMGEQSYYKNGVTKYPKIGGGDVTEEKLIIQRSLRMVVSGANNNESIVRKSDMIQATSQINPALSSMVAKGHKGLADALTIRLAEIYNSWNKDSDALSGNSLADQLSRDIPTMGDK